MKTEIDIAVEYCICYNLFSEILGTPFIIQSGAEGYIEELSAWMVE